MNEDTPAITYVTWSAARRPAFHLDEAALVRWAQARRMTTVPAWRVDNEQCRMVPVMATRDGQRWDISGQIVPADELDDPWPLEIVDFMERELNRIDFTPVRVAVAAWRSPDPANDPLGLYAPFGFLPPVLAGEDWIWRYCPELIAAQTEHLTDESREFYLHYINLRVSLHPTYVDLDDRERENIIENSVYDSGPDQHHIITEVQMRALDARRC